MIPDPFTQTLDKLWELLESHEGLASLVRLGNRIKLTGAAGGGKGSLRPADLPEVRIVPAGGKIELFATSTSSRAVQEYAIVVVAAGDVGVDASLFPLKWQLLKALSRGGDSLGLSFVRKVRVTDLAEKAQGPDGRAGAGWTAWLTVAVEMWLPTAELRA